MIILDKARESLHKFLSTTKGKLVALFIYLAFGQQIASLIGTGLPVILFLAYAFIIYRSIDKIKNKPFYIKFIISKTNTRINEHFNVVCTWNY